jgi:glycosyltransferase involved in cell wall biosynthesis
MKVALVHDYLNQIGGGERVLDVLMQMFPDAPVYTLMYDEEKTQGRYAGRVKGTSFLDFQFARDHHRVFIPLMPLATRSINLGSAYDLIISTSAGFSKGIRYDRKTTKHICYVHTPLRYAWEKKTYFGHRFSTKLFTAIFAPAFWYVKRFDYKSAQKPDVLIANSQYIADKIKKYYKRDAVAIYPPVDTNRFHPVVSEPGREISSHYYLAIGRLLHYKRFDLIIDAFNKLGLPLQIVGAGPKEKLCVLR